MKKQVVKNVENVANQVANAKGVTTQSAKPAPAETANESKPTRKDTRGAFLQFIVSREEIGLNKFFKLFAAFKSENPAAYGEFLAARNLDFATDYSFAWFKANCPSIEENGKQEFARWRKVTDKQPANENPAYNRVSEKGVMYTLVAYHCTRANWGQYESMFNDVLREIARLKREKEKARKEKEKAETAQKLADKRALQLGELLKKMNLTKDEAIKAFEKAKAEKAA